MERHDQQKKPHTMNCLQLASAVAEAASTTSTDSRNSSGHRITTTISINKDSQDGLLHDLVVPIDADDPASMKKMSAEEREQKQKNQGAMAIGSTVQNRVAAYLAATAMAPCDGTLNSSSIMGGSEHCSATKRFADPEDTISAVVAQQHRFADFSKIDTGTATTAASNGSTTSGHRKSKSLTEVGAFFMPASSTARTKGMQYCATDDGGDASVAPPPVPIRDQNIAKQAMRASCQDSVSTATPMPLQLSRNRDVAATTQPGAVHVRGRPSPHPSGPPQRVASTGTSSTATNEISRGIDHSQTLSLLFNQSSGSFNRSGRASPGHSRRRHRRSRSATSHQSFGVSGSELAASAAGADYCESSEEEEEEDVDGLTNDDDGSFSYAELMDEDDDGLGGGHLETQHEVANESASPQTAQVERYDPNAYQQRTSSNINTNACQEALIIAAELSPPDLNDVAARAVLTESEVEERVRQKILQEATEAHVVMAAENNTIIPQNEKGDRTLQNSTIKPQELSEEAKRVAEFKALHKHKTIREKVFGNARSQQTIDIGAAPECIRKRSTLKWTVRRNPATNLWVAAVHTNQKALETNDLAELERSVKSFSAVTQKEALEIGQATAKPKMLRYSDNPICYVCRDKFALLRRPSHCRNCGVCICNACVVHWPAKMVPETFRKRRGNESGAGAGARYVKVCLACDWLSTSFREALNEGNYETAVDLYATGNINLRTPFANVKKTEILYPIHAAILGGNLRLVQWLTNTHCAPLRHSGKASHSHVMKLKRVRDGPVRTSRGRSALQLAMEHNKMEIVCHLIGERKMTFSDEREFKDVTTLVTFAESLVQMLPPHFFEHERPNRIEGTTLPASPAGSSPQDLVAMLHAESISEAPPSPVMSQGSAFPCDVSSLGPSASQAERRGSF